MLIRTSQIKDFLEREGISYSLLGTPDEEYKITSVFNPEPEGFYYFIDNDIPSEINSSLILSNTELTTRKDNCNLVVDQSPKVLFYKILEFFFKKRSNGTISDKAVIDPDAEIGNNVQIDSFAVIGKCKISANSIIGSHSVIEDNSIIKRNTVIGSHSSVGAQGIAWVWNEDETRKIQQPQLGGVLIEENSFIGTNSVIVRGSLNENTYIGKCTMIAPGVRIGHGTKVGAYVHFANNIITGGNAIIGDYSFIGSSAVFRPHVKIHPYSIVGSGAVVVKNTSKEGVTLIGVPAEEFPTKKKPSGMPKPKNTN